MESRIKEIENGLMTCLKCIHYRNQDCGAYFIQPPMKSISEEQLFMASPDEIEKWNAMDLSHRCEKASIDGLPFGIVSHDIPDGQKRQRRFLANCKRLLSLIPSDNMFMREFGDEIKEAILDLVCCLDFTMLENDIDILPDIKLVGIDYDRERNLYPKYSQGLVDHYVNRIQKVNEISKLNKSKICNVNHDTSLINTDAHIYDPLYNGVAVFKQNALLFMERYVNDTWKAVSEETMMEEETTNHIKNNNKQLFTKELLAISSLTEEEYRRSIQFVNDKLIGLFNKNKQYMSRTKYFDIYNIQYGEIQDILIDYIAASYLHSISRPPYFCFESVIRNLDIKLEGVDCMELLSLASKSLGISDQLLLKYREDQCERCRMRGCLARISSLPGIAAFVGSGADDYVIPEECDKPNYQSPALESGKTIVGILESGTEEIEEIEEMDEPMKHYDLSDKHNEPCYGILDEQRKMGKSGPFLSDDLRKYFDALHEGGFLTNEYKWISKGHTQYHAGWAAKIIIANVEGVTYDKITDIIGVKRLADSASKCQNQVKKSKIEEIETCFNQAGLSIRH